MRSYKILFLSYLVTYFLLLSHIEKWGEDLSFCYFFMTPFSFFLHHFPLFIYFFLFVMMSFYMVSTFFYLLKQFYKKHLLKKYFFSLKRKLWKNILIIQHPSYIALSFEDKIILSTSILQDFSPLEKKALFLHEKAHLLYKDPQKYFWVDIFLRLFPKKISYHLWKNFVLQKEFLADIYSTQFVPPKALFQALLKSTYLPSSFPQMKTFFEERLLFYLSPSFSTREIYFLIGSLFFFSLSILLLSLCFCL